MELNPFWKAASRSPTQELPNILRNSKVQYRVHKSPPLVSIPIQNKPIHTSPSYLRSILILSTHLRLGLPNGLLPSGFPMNTLYKFFPIRATYPTNLIFDCLVILIIFGEEYKLRSSSLCSFLQPPVTSSLFGPNIFFLIWTVGLWVLRPLLTYCTSPRW
jgi:hypothetical protein